jgi:hypothetical protein
MGSVSHSATDSAILASSTMAHEADFFRARLGDMHAKLEEAISYLVLGVKALTEYKEASLGAAAHLHNASEAQATARISLDVYLEPNQA